jgi:tol-pal system protein YbgF
MKYIIKPTLFCLVLMSSFAYAEHTAPVYDVDSMSNDDATQEVSVVKPAAASLSVEQRLARLEQQLENAQQNDATKQLASMQGEVQALRGQVEELTHRLQEMSNQQQLSKVNAEPSMSAFPRVADDDATPNKITRNKSGSAAVLADKKSPVSSRGSKAMPSTAAQEKTTAATVQPNLAEEQAVYQTAYNLIKAKKYDEAIAALQKMLVKYPAGQFAANAHYWLGELYSLTGQHEQAAAEFVAVVKHYPSNPRVADSELKLGLIYATQLKWVDAKASFAKVVHQYPGTPSARLAMEQLKQLKQAGH